MGSRLTVLLPKSSASLPHFDMQINKYVFELAGSNMYVAFSGKKALVIDPNVSEEALAELRRQQIDEITVLLTHEHYDHTSGLVWLCEQFRSTVICHEQTACALRLGRNNRPIIIASNRMQDLSPDAVKAMIETLPQGYRYEADVTFSKEYTFDWEGHRIRMVAMPGHSKGGCCIEIDHDTVLTGDLLIWNTPVITRFPGGSEELYQALTLPYLESLPDSVTVLPGHGRQFLMSEYRK